MKDYDPRNWYWFVGSDQSRAYSSAAGEFVPAGDAALGAWRADGTIPSSIASLDELAELLGGLSLRPLNADLLDRYKTAPASRLTMEIVAKVLFNHENRIRQLAGQTAVTVQQFTSALKAML